MKVVDELAIGMGGAPKAYSQDPIVDEKEWDAITVKGVPIPWQWLLLGGAAVVGGIILLAKPRKGTPRT